MVLGCDAEISYGERSMHLNRLISVVEGNWSFNVFVLCSQLLDVETLAQRGGDGSNCRHFEIDA